MSLCTDAVQPLPVNITASCSLALTALRTMSLDNTQKNNKYGVLTKLNLKILTIS